jgi:hypothetical protein
MKVKFGSIIVDGRGKLGGHVYSKNRSGAYVRTKVTPDNPQTSYQTEARSKLAQFSSSWKGLTQTQRDAWDGAVEDYAKTNIFGDLIKPTGKNLYTALNMNLANVNEPSIAVPPLPDAVFNAENLAFDDLDSTDISIEFDGDTGMKYQVDATPPLSPGVNFFKEKYKRIDVITGAAQVSESIKTAYVARFGNPPAGTKIAVRVTAVNTTTGQRGTGVVISGIIGS